MTKEQAIEHLKTLVTHYCYWEEQGRADALRYALTVLENLTEEKIVQILQTFGQENWELGNNDDELTELAQALIRGIRE